MLDWREFAELAKETFGFLVAEYSFRCVSEARPFVVFSNQKLQVSVFFDANRNGELDLGLERCADVGKTKPFYRIGQFKRLRGYSFPEPTVAPFLRSREGAILELNSLASQLRLHCIQALKGDLSDLDRIDQQSSRNFG